MNNFTLPDCLTYKYAGINCPGCGCTRAVEALVQGDILLSLRQNASIIIAGIVALIFYLEQIFLSFGKKMPNPLRNKVVLIIFLVLLGIYYILRNFVPELAPI